MTKVELMTAGNWKHLNAPIKSMSTLFIESVCLPDIKMDWNKSPMKPYQAANSCVSYLQPAKWLISLRCRHHYSPLLPPHPILNRPAEAPRRPRIQLLILGRQTNGRIKHLYSKPEEADRQQAGRSWSVHYQNGSAICSLVTGNICSWSCPF